MDELLIKNGAVVFENDTQIVDLLIQGEQIAAILSPGNYQGPAPTLDAEGLIVMPGTIDPHVHYGLYNDIGEDFKFDTPVQALGGMTCLVNYHRGKQDYYDSLPAAIEAGERNSLIDFAFTLGFVKKQDVQNLEGYVKKLGVTSFKFFFDKQDIADQFYNISKDDMLTLDKADLYNLLLRMSEFNPKLLMCIHCEDRDLFKMLEQKLEQSDADRYALSSFCATRPDFVETICIADAMLISGVTNGNIYIVHTSAKSSVQVYEALKHMAGTVTLETCPHYLIMDENIPAGLNAKVNPPLRQAVDNEALWKGIADGNIKTIGSDNALSCRKDKFAAGNDFMKTFTGFGSHGLILPTLIGEGYLKRKIPLHLLSRVNSINTARAFQLPKKGEIRVGYDADLALVDPHFTRSINSNLYGNTDYSIYEGISFTGWPRYTLSRGELIVNNGIALNKQGRGKYLYRTL